ncbi:MAG: hypothetical protein ACI9VR_003359 [Cognaticolwellia sp.]|jgi:hypothetical protein
MLFSLLLALTAESTTTTGQARACINNHVSEGYQAGWRVRNVSAFEVTEDNNRYMLLDLVGEVEYRFVSCGDDRARAVRIVVYDDKGRLVDSTGPDEEGAEGRQAEMTFMPPSTGSYFVGVRLLSAHEVPVEVIKKRGLLGRNAEVTTQVSVPAAGIGLGILYR